MRHRYDYNEGGASPHVHYAPDDVTAGVNGRPWSNGVAGRGRTEMSADDDAATLGDYNQEIESIVNSLHNVIVNPDRESKAALAGGGGGGGGGGEGAFAGGWGRMEDELEEGGAEEGRRTRGRRGIRVRQSEGGRNEERERIQTQPKAARSTSRRRSSVWRKSQKFGLCKYFSKSSK